MKAAVMLVAVAAGAFALAGCGGDGSQTTTTTDTEAVVTTTDTSTVETATTETTPATPKPTTIVIVVDNGRPRGGIKRPNAPEGRRGRRRRPRGCRRGGAPARLRHREARDARDAGAHSVHGEPARPVRARAPPPGRSARSPGGAALSRPDVVAHGIGGVQDLPVPAWMFYWGAAVVLVVSFVLLGVLWRKPLLGAHERGRGLSAQASRLVLGPLRVVAQVLSVALFLLVLLSALVGDTDPFRNLAPTWIYVIFWLGLPALDRRLRLRVARALTVARDGRCVRLGAGARRR